MAYIQRKPKHGDLIFVKRKLGYFHVGICSYRNKVIHFSGVKDDSILNTKNVKIIETSLEDFARGDQYFINDPYDSPYMRFKVVLRAKKHLGTTFMNKPYHLITNNCEHFARYIYYGKKDSVQINNIENLLKIATSIGIVAGAAKDAVSFIKNKLSRKN